MNEAMNLNTLEPTTPIEGVTADNTTPVTTSFVAAPEEVSTPEPVSQGESIISTPSETPQVPDIFSTSPLDNSILNGGAGTVENSGLMPLSASQPVNTNAAPQAAEEKQQPTATPVPNPQPIPTISTPTPIGDNQPVSETPTVQSQATMTQPTIQEQTIPQETIAAQTPVEPTSVGPTVQQSIQQPTPIEQQPVSPVVESSSSPVEAQQTVLQQTELPASPAPVAAPAEPVPTQVATTENTTPVSPEVPSPIPEQGAPTVQVQTPSSVDVEPTAPAVEQPTSEITNNEATTNSHYAKNDSLFSNIDFGPLEKYLDDDNITDISYSNGGQLWLKTLDKGIYREPNSGVTDALVEKIAFQCSNVMGKTFNMAQPFLDSESAELRMNFVHDSIAKNGIAAVFRKTPAKIRLEKEKIIADKYVTANIHDFLIKCVEGHCNIIVSGETGSGKTELVKYLASHTAENEKIITIEDTLELHLDRIFPERDIVAMKTNNIASYSDVLVTCMRQNPKWILLSEVRSAEAVTAVRNSISSGHNILSTIHSDKAVNIPHRLYSLLESNIDVDQFLKTIYRYIQLGIFVRGRYDSNEKRFVREIAEVTEFYVDDDNCIGSNTIYRKTVTGVETYNPASKYLKTYLEGQGVDVTNLLGREDLDIEDEAKKEEPSNESNENIETENEIETL